jgi:ATP-dependent DNA ligase
MRGAVLHSRLSDRDAIACAFDLLMLNGDDLLRRPFAERKTTLSKVLRRTKGGIQFVEATRYSQPFASSAWKELSQRN